jgi:hypothetical protein
MNHTNPNFIQLDEKKFNLLILPSKQQKLSIFIKNYMDVVFDLLRYSAHYDWQSLARKYDLDLLQIQNKIKSNHQALLENNKRFINSIQAISRRFRNQYSRVVSNALELKINDLKLKLNKIWNLIILIPRSKEWLSNFNFLALKIYHFFIKLDESANKKLINHYNIQPFNIYINNKINKMDKKKKLIFYKIKYKSELLDFNEKQKENVRFFKHNDNNIGVDMVGGSEGAENDRINELLEWDQPAINMVENLDAGKEVAGGFNDVLLDNLNDTMVIQNDINSINIMGSEIPASMDQSRSRKRRKKRSYRCRWTTPYI